MKTLKLFKEYNRLSVVSVQDRHLFRKLLKGENNKRLSRELLIMPVNLESDLICHGFAIEHHQLFISEATDQFYLVFWPLNLEDSLTYHCPFSVYSFTDNPHQQDYVCLARHKNINAHSVNLFSIYQS